MLWKTVEEDIIRSTMDDDILEVGFTRRDEVSQCFGSALKPPPQNRNPLNNMIVKKVISWAILMWMTNMKKVIIQTVTITWMMVLPALLQF